MKKPNLTGQRRFREQLIGVPWETLPNGDKIVGRFCLVLQVEICQYVLKKGEDWGRWVCSWRDATPEDITSAETVI